MKKYTLKLTITKDGRMYTKTVDGAQLVKMALEANPDIDIGNQDEVNTYALVKFLKDTAVVSVEEFEVAANTEE